MIAKKHRERIPIMGSETAGPFAALLDDCVGAEAAAEVSLDSELDLVADSGAEEGGITIVENPEVTGVVEVEVEVEAGGLIGVVRGGKEVESVPTTMVDKGASDSAAESVSEFGMGIVDVADSSGLSNEPDMPSSLPC
jgi:hypothetical protein